MYSRLVMTGGVSFAGDRNKLFQPEEAFYKIKDKSFYTSDYDYSGWLEEASLKLQEALADPTRVSAEYTVIKQLIKQGELRDSFTLEIVVSDTYGGHMAGDLLELLLEAEFGRKATVLVRAVPMNVEDNAAMTSMLGHYLLAVNDLLQGGTSYDTLFVPLGGYKVMTSLATSVAHLNRMDAYYMHEQKQELIKVPWLPIDVDMSFIEQHKSIVKQLNEGKVGLAGLDNMHKQLVSSHPYLFNVTKTDVELNAFGKFLVLRDGFRYLYDTRIVLTDQVAAKLAGNRQWEVRIYTEIRRLLEGLKSGIESAHYRHELEFKQLNQSKVKLNLLKSKRKGDLVIRLSYLYDEQKDELLINHLWTDHAIYEQEAAKGVGLYERQKGEQDITKEFYKSM